MVVVVDERRGSMLVKTRLFRTLNLGFCWIVGEGGTGEGTLTFNQAATDLESLYQKLMA